MNAPEDRQRKQEFKRQKTELQAKEHELRLRELEIEIYEEQKARKSQIIQTEPLHATRKHDPAENSFHRFARKIIKYAKFTGFTVVGIAIVKAGFLIGMSISYLIMMAIIVGIGYQIFLKSDR